jgi:hypothetical protein
VDNPAYSGWAKHSPGATATLSESTTYAGTDDKDPVPDSKVVTYTLVSTSPKQAVVRAVVVEQELLGTVESAPTRHTYPAKLKKSYLAVAAPDLDAKEGEETIKWKGKDMKCKTLFGSYKAKDGSEVNFKAWINPSVPGGFVKRTRTVTQGKTVITTTVELQSFKAGGKKAAKTE